MWRTLRCSMACSYRLYRLSSKNRLPMRRAVEFEEEASTATHASTSIQDPATTAAAMPSPFPGMDPYLEGSAVWPDFHNRLAYRDRSATRRTAVVERPAVCAGHRSARSAARLSDGRQPRLAAGSAASLPTVSHQRSRRAACGPGSVAAGRNRGFPRSAVRFSSRLRRRAVHARGGRLFAALRSAARRDRRRLGRGANRQSRTGRIRANVLEQLRNHVRALAAVDDGDGAAGARRDAVGVGIDAEDAAERGQ